MLKIYLPLLLAAVTCTHTAVFAAGPVAGPAQEKQASRLPDLRPEEPAITVNGAAISWGALRDHAELLMSEMRLPPGVTRRQFDEERENLLLRRIYAIGKHHVLKTLLGQEARRQGVEISPLEAATKEQEVLDRIKSSRRDFQRYLAVFQTPGSFFHHDLTNSLLLKHLDERIIKPSIRISDSDLEAAYQERSQKNREYREYNQGLKPRLERIRQQIESGAEQFSEVAFAESDCDSSYEYGEVGSKVLADLQPAMVAALTNMAPGELSQVVETPYSFHLLKLNKLNRGFPREGDTNAPPVVSISFAQIMLEKKEFLPEISADKLRQELIEAQMLARREALQNELLANAKIESALNVGLNEPPKPRRRRR